jgi:phenylpropionate dioxygenase-like ring-hydroxylating dioxygenase large terminal subunit
MPETAKSGANEMSATESSVASDTAGLAPLVAAVLADSSPTLANARLLPPGAYVSQAFFDLEVQKIFKREWLCVGHVCQVANVGDYFTIDLLGEMLVVVRAHDGVHVLSRVCLHRWAQLVSGDGKAKGFTCPFHGWTYSLDGALISAPHMEQAEGFEPKKCRLPEVRSEIVEELGLIFINFSGTADSISKRLEDFSLRLKNYRMNELVAVRPGATNDAYNWKIGISTGMEIYHHYITHRDTFQGTHPTRLGTCEEAKPGWTVCHAGAVGDPRRAAKLPFLPDLTDDERGRMDLYYVFPNLRLIVYPDTIRVRVIIPVSPAHTKTGGFNLIRPETAQRSEAVEAAFSEAQKFMQQVGREDDDVSMMQQRGATSALASAGRLSHLEASLWHLAEYVRARVALP